MTPASPEVEVRLATGEGGSALAFDGRWLRLRTPRACAVGERVEVELGGPVLRVRGKVVRVVRAPGGDFEVTLSLISLPRADRLALELRLASGGGAGGLAGT